MQNLNLSNFFICNVCLSAPMPKDLSWCLFLFISASIAIEKKERKMEKNSSAVQFISRKNCLLSEQKKLLIFFSCWWAEIYDKLFRAAPAALPFSQ